MQMIKTATMIVLMALAFGVSAQTASVKGMGDTTYDSWSLKPETKEDALSAAKVNAIERYIAKSGDSKSRNFNLVRDTVEENPDAFLLGHRVVSETHDEDGKSYQVVIRADINQSRLSNALQDVSAVGSSSSAEKSYITFVFVARQQGVVRTYDDKDVERTDTETFVQGEDRQASSGSGVEYASEETRSEKTTSGGSTTKKADAVKYRVTTTEGINSVMSRVFSTSGFKVVEAGYLEGETDGLISVDAFKNDYRSGDDISSETKRRTAKGAKRVDVPYVAVGTLDVGMKDQDPASGLDRIHVTVSGKVLDVSSRFPQTVASVGPVQFAGTGPNQDVARNNALEEAASRAAEQLTEQLNARGVK